MSYLQKIYHESMFLLEKGILLYTFYSYPDLKQLLTMFIFSSKTHYKLGYKRSIVHNFGTLYLNLHLVLGLMNATDSLWKVYRYG